MQLRRIVAEVNRFEPVAYDFLYADTGPQAEEIDEWFVYQFWQWVRLNAAQRAFEWQWQHEYRSRTSWEEADLELRSRLVREAIEGVVSDEPAQRSPAVGKILYLVLGRWGDTATAGPVGDGRKSAASASQLAAIGDGVKLLTAVDGIQVIWKALRSSFELLWSAKWPHIRVPNH
jgi:hypothetical protein